MFGAINAFEMDQMKSCWLETQSHAPEAIRF